MSDIEIKMDALNKQITDLKLKYDELRSINIIELQEKLRPLVGKSFKDKDNNYFRIIDVPHVEYNKTYTSLNEYQIPALVCYAEPRTYEDGGWIDIVTRFSTASHDASPIDCIRREYVEVSPEEFDATLEKAFDEIRALGKRGDAKCSGTV